MENIFNDNLIYVKVDEVAQAKNVSTRAIRKACEKNNYIYRYSAEKTRCKGGKQYEILLSSLEPEVQAKIMENRGTTCTALAAVGSSIGSLQDNSDFQAPIFLNSAIELSEGVPSLDINETQNALFSSQTALIPININKPESQKEIIPDKAKKLALAKVDLISHWEAYRNGQPSRAKADKEFIIGYRSKIICPNLYEIIGDVSVKSLHRWLKDLKDNNYDYKALVPNYKYGSESNYNTCLSNIEQTLLRDFMLRPNKLSVGNAYRLIGFALKNKGFSQASLASYKRYIDKFKRNNKDVWTFMREGAKALNDKVSPYIIRDKKALQVGDVLVADGNVLDFQMQNPFTGRPCRAVMVCYQDFYSSDIAGFDIMLTENTQCVASALRNSIIRLGKIPKIAYQDNGRAFKNRFFKGKTNLEESGFYGLFGSLGIKAVFTKPYHGQSKPIERFFREFTQTCASLVNSYVGNNIENKPAYMKRNEIIHKAIHDNYIPTIEEAIDIVNAWLEFYRSQPCPADKSRTIGEVFNEGKGSGVDTEQLDDLMMSAHKVRTIGRNGIKMFGNYYYHPALYEIEGKVNVRYSLFNIFEIKVYSQKGEFICRAEALKEIHPFAAQLGEANDEAALKRALSEQKKFEKATLKKAKSLLPGVNKKYVDWQKEKIAQSKPAKKEIKEEKYKITCYENVEAFPQVEGQKYSLIQ